MDERSTAVALFTTGNQVALFLGNPLAAGLCDSSFGWRAVFYVSAAMGTAWCVAWMLLGSNTPDECRMMKMEERLFLKRNAQTPPVPWMKILTNKAFIAHLVATWILTNVVTIMMNGTFTSLPMMFNFMFKLTWGVLVDKFKAKKILTQTLGSFIYPCINTIVANWFPMDERSTAVALFTTGNQVALFLGNPLAAGLCDSSLGWRAVFYVSAAMGAAWCVAWMLLGSNTPDECRMMKMEERLFLKRKAQTPPVPWLKILTNKAFIAHLVATWILTNVVTIMMVYLPTYFKDVLLLGVIMNGTFTSLPMMFNFMFKLTWGVLVDKLKAKKILTQTLGVKISQCFPTFGVAMGLIPVVLFVSCQQPALALALFCFTNLCLGAHTSGAYTSLLSLAPQFTPTLSSISVSMSMLAQLTTPFMVAVVNKTGTMQEWNNLFLITALMCVFSGVFFLIFGSGDVQEFAKSPKDVERFEDGSLLSPHQRASALRADSVSML
ncbi:transporter, major facilitator family protein [Ancylostoma duodenale]|uniref:Transporter, major facilitator family protein n=1 Tax=Ancylostoma duodenale TaxID=51022 RepID=A0A0C2GM32_9BILA|nr:transporter, major facilitator family protein [Ancylostoma duodenale]